MLPSTLFLIADLNSVASAGWQFAAYKYPGEPPSNPFYVGSGDADNGACRPLLNTTGTVTTAREILVSKYGNKPNACGIYDIDTWAGNGCGVAGAAKSFSRQGINYMAGFFDLTQDPYLPIKSLNITCHYGV